MTDELIPSGEFVRQIGDFALFIGRREQYQELYRKFGEEGFVDLLVSINEISALNYYQRKTGLLNRVLADKRVVARLEKDSEAYLSHVSFERLITRLQMGYAAPPPKRLDFTIDIGKDKELEFSFSFPSELKGTQTCCALIGPNGIGKTRAITAFARQTANFLRNGSWPSRTRIYTHDFLPFRRIRSSEVDLLSMRPSEANWKRATSILANTIVETSKLSRPFDALDRLLSDVIPLERLYLPLLIDPSPPHSVANAVVYQGDKPYIAFDKFFNEGARGTHLELYVQRERSPQVMTSDQYLAYPSSGEMTLFLFLLSILVECDRGSLVLVDEPENHLHPQFISMFMRKLSDALIDTDSRAIVVTHSPFVIRELDKASVRIMQRDEDGDVALFAPTLQTHGANVSLISHYVFGDEFITKGFEQTIDRMYSRTEGAVPQRILDEVGRQFGSDGVSYLLRTVGAKQ